MELITERKQIIIVFYKFVKGNEVNAFIPTDTA